MTCIGGGNDVDEKLITYHLYTPLRYPQGT